jgi:hypothetical protein
MPEGAREVSHDFWRPAQAPRVGLESMFSAAYCGNCGTEFAVGARFCHVCGSMREPLPETGSRLGRWADLGRVVRTDLNRILLGFTHARERLGLNLASFILLLLACGCALGALLAEPIYRPTNVMGWQAVQMWRIEWMLGAIAALLAALLLREPLS